MANTKQKQLFEASLGGPNAKTAMSDIIAVGYIVDTNDPMQWARIRAVVPAWGDSWESSHEGMPWCMQVNPLGGTTSVGTRGPDVHTSEGGVAYGMWAVPKVGAQVVVMSLDEDHQQRLYLGCLHDAFMTNTLPHGRWISDDHPEIDTDIHKHKPYGPFSANDKLIQPLANNIAQAFGTADGGVNHERATRAADYSATGVDVSQLHNTASKIQDDKGVDDGTGRIRTQGYQVSRIDPTKPSSLTDKNYDSQVMSMTSPGFHAISMDDRMENCRMRMRTSSGHQILMDDTNERIYISTAQGNNWVEMDQAGNVDVFSSMNVSIRAGKNVNITADKDVRIHGGTGVHLHSNEGVRVTGVSGIDLNSGKSVNISAGNTLNLKSGADVRITSSSTLNLKAGGEILHTGSHVHFNGPGAASAETAQNALFTNRIPAHEPWARSNTKSGDSHEPEHGYTDSKVGRFEDGHEIPRGPFWGR